MKARRGVAVTSALTVTILSGCTQSAPPTENSPTPVAQTTVSWRGDRLTYLGPAGQGTIVVSDRGAWTISGPGAAAVPAPCCSGATTLVTGTVDLAGKPWVVRADGVPLGLDGVEHPAASAILALNGPVQLPPPNMHDSATRAVKPRSVAVVDSSTVLVATSSVENASPQSAGHSDDVMIWKVAPNQPPVQLAGVPSDRFQRSYWTSPAYNKAGVDPMTVELDTVQGIAALAPNSYAVLLTHPGAAGTSSTPTSAIQRPKLDVAELTDGTLRGMPSNGLSCFDVATNLARLDEGFVVSAAAYDSAECDGKTTSAAFLPGQTARWFAYGAGPSIHVGDTYVAASSSATGLTVLWTRRSVATS